MTLIDPAKFITNAERITSVYGEWPRFHDAEIVSVELSREEPSLIAHIKTFRVHRDQLDEGRFYRRTDFCIVALRFTKIADLHIDGFNHQNVLADIVFENSNGGVLVNMEGIFGATITFRCSKVSVDEVLRCD
jgi:hypothetical protein